MLRVRSVLGIDSGIGLRAPTSSFLAFTKIEINSTL